MRTTEESRILKEYFLNAALLAMALEAARDLAEFEEICEEEPAFSEEAPMPAAA